MKIEHDHHLVVGNTYQNWEVVVGNTYQSWEVPSKLFQVAEQTTLEELRFATCFQLNNDESWHRENRTLPSLNQSQETTNIKVKRIVKRGYWTDTVWQPPTRPSKRPTYVAKLKWLIIDMFFWKYFPSHNYFVVYQQ